MDWENERYVRLYTRPTLTTKQLKWQGRAVLAELLKAVDRCGILDLEGHDLASDAGIDALASVLDMPVDVTKYGLERLLFTKTVQCIPSGLFLPKFLRAQEAKQSDPQRQRESRAKRHAEARAAALGVGVGGPDVSRNVTEGHETIRGGMSRNVTNPPDPWIETGQDVTPSRATPGPNGSEAVPAAWAAARAALLRFREKSRDRLNVPRIAIGSKPDSEPTDALIELMRKALQRHHPVYQRELDEMADAIGRGLLWYSEKVLPASRLLQIPDQRRPDNFENALVWVRSPDRTVPPLFDSEHPSRVLGRSARNGAKRPSSRAAEPVEPAAPAPTPSPADPRQAAWDFAHPRKEPADA